MTAALSAVQARSPGPLAAPASARSNTDADLIAQAELAHRKRRGRDRLIVALGQVLLILVFLGAWDFASGRLVDARAISDPLSVLTSLWQLAVSGRLWPNVWQTLIEVGLGFAFGTVIGLALALAFAIFPSAQAVLRPFLIGFYAIPKIALAPLVVMWFGLGTMPKVVLAGAFVFFIVFMNAAGGASAVNPNHIVLTRIMGASRLTIARKVVLPSTLPFLLTGLRLAIPEAVIGAVIGEFIAADQGLGYLVSTASSQFNMAVSIAAILAILVIVAIADFALSFIERRFMRWRPSVASTHSF